MAVSYLRLYSDYEEGGYFLFEIYGQNQIKDMIQAFEITYFTKRGHRVGFPGEGSRSMEIICKDVKNKSPTLIDNYELTLYINKPCFRLLEI